MIGRSSEVIRLGKHYVYPISLSVILDDFHNINECQFVHQKDHLKIRIIPSGNYSEEDSRNIEERFRELYDYGFKLELELVDNLKRNKAGKFLFVMPA